ncbi:hypothetical protein JOQ06_027784 [Pogonophryne albipinna]|uniref:Uncharacterized protein n=1 Tax=Pogonophryne albipinna TaxID=1090488 RepID=A0AAD6ABS7_9TELE|nr:hypothetical protein JOQ06_027784 [Pogonophryne albipinna]
MVNNSVRLSKYRIPEADPEDGVSYASVSYTRKSSRKARVYAEFQRITNQNLLNTFYAAFDRHLPRLMAIFRQKASKSGKTAEALAEILKIHDEQELHDINTRCTSVIHALPVYLQEDTSGFFRTCTRY